MHPEFLLLTLIPVLGVNAQQFGEIRGTVTDASGAAIVDASVTLTNVATQQVRAALTNEAGIYSAPAILPARLHRPRRKTRIQGLFPNRTGSSGWRCDPRRLRFTN